MLQLRGVAKSFGGQEVLSDVSLALREGEIVCLLGSSGCGKTTLLRIIAGLEQADRGELLFHGKDLAQVPVHERNFGLMFQGYALFPHMSVEQNVAFGLRMRRLDDVAERTREILALVGLAGMGARDVSSLSGGEQQRVALARSLAPRPPLLMLDEPLASLDAGLRERLMPELRRIFTELKQTVITVTHDQREANAIADRVAVMNAGCIEQIDTPQALYARPRTAFVARFLGLGNLVSSAWLSQQTGASVQTEQVLLHPAGIHLGSAQVSRLTLHGALEQRVYEGGGWRLSARVGGEILRFRLPLGGHPVPEPGESLWLQLDPDWIIPLA